MTSSRWIFVFAFVALLAGGAYWLKGGAHATASSSVTPELPVHLQPEFTQRMLAQAEALHTKEFAKIAIAKPPGGKRTDLSTTKPAKGN